MTNYREERVNVNGEDIEVYRVDADSNGNPRYVVHFLSLGVKLEDYGKIKGLTRYRAKWFGGGYVIQSYNIEQDLKHCLELVNNYYKERV